MIGLHLDWEPPLPLGGARELKFQGASPCRHYRARPAAAGDSAADDRRLGRVATYATTLAGIYLSVGFLFYFAAKEKLFADGGTMPAGLVKAFHGSFFANVPGDNAAWVLLGLTEAAVVVILAVSLLRGEFLPQRRKPIRLAGLGVSMLAYGMMIVANAMIGNNPTVIELFTYFGVTAVVMFMVRQMSPYRPMSWLAGEATE
ncbi:MAG: hypothetical protein ACR2NR_07390 [Solirubrobacteraceae bacterium]